MEQNFLLYDKDRAKEFYEDRYRGGYMEDWAKEKKQRIFALLKDLDLPETGEAIEFGCGNGVFTDIVRQALPKWQIYGYDISKIAIANAAKRFDQCRFFFADSEELKNKKFDFLFSHHTLEHVYDIEKAIEEMSGYLKDRAFMLHILPCGNEGSFEYNFCRQVTDGIDEKMENRFYFEDFGHLRRMTSARLSALLGKFSFALKKSFFANQYYGALNWITKSSPKFVWKNIIFAKAKKGFGFGLLKHKILLGGLAFFRLPVVLMGYALNKDRAYLYIFLPLLAVFYLLVKPLDYYLRQRAEQEWANKKTEQNGSEMYLFFERTGL